MHDRHILRPVGLSGGDHRRPGAEYKYCQPREGDVLATMQLVFQQSKMYMKLVVLQIQFFARVLDIPAACTDWHAQCNTVQQTVEISQVQFLAWLSTRRCCATTGLRLRATLGSTVDTCSASVASFYGGFLEEFHASQREGGLSDPEVGLVLFSSPQRRTTEKCAQ